MNSSRPLFGDVAGRLMVAVAVAGLTGWVFWPSLRYEFIHYWDDLAHVEVNDAYKGFSWTHIKWFFHPFLGQFMPLTWASWALDFKLFGLNSMAYHRTNVLLHAANAGLLFLVARRVIRAALPHFDRGYLLTLGAAFTALAWALHPLRVESVAWVNERRDVLCGFFYLLAVLTYLLSVASRMTPEERNDIAPKVDLGSWTRGASTPGRNWLIVSIVCFALAVLSKALAVALPITLLLLDWYPLRRRAFAEKIPYVVISTVGTIMAFVALVPMGVLAEVHWITVEDRLLITPYSFWWYFAKTLWPGALSPLYELTFVPHLFQWRYFIPVVGVGYLTVLAVQYRRQAPAWTVAWFAYLVTVFPISGFFQNGYQIVAARYAYLATLPLLILAGGLLVEGLERMRIPVRALSLAGAGAVVVALAMATTAYLPAFHDGIAFWIRAVRVEPSCVACSDFLVHQAKFSVAHAEMNRVLIRHPELQEQRFEIGMLSFMYAHGPEGEAHFTEYLRQATERDPGYIPRIERGRQQHLELARKVLTGSPQLSTTFEGDVHGFASAPQPDYAH